VIITENLFAVHKLSRVQIPLAPGYDQYSPQKKT